MTRDWISFSLLIIVAASVFALFVQETPPSNKELVSLVLGVLLGCLKDSCTFFFGGTVRVDNAPPQRKDPP